jgi:hypothetical protein
LRSLDIPRDSSHDAADHARSTNGKQKLDRQGMSIAPTERTHPHGSMSACPIPEHDQMTFVSHNEREPSNGSLIASAVNSDPRGDYMRLKPFELSMERRSREELDHAYADEVQL